MPTISEIKASINSLIRSKIAASSITKFNVANILDSLADAVEALRLGGGANTVQSLTDAATIQWNYSSGNWATVVIGGNRSINVTNSVSGKAGVVSLTQDSTGNRTISYNGSQIPVNPEPGSTTIIGFTNFNGTLLWSTNYSSSTPSLSAPVLTATAISDARIDLSWTTPTHATGFILQRATNAGFTTGVATLYTGASTTYSDTGRTASTQYFYRVQATADGYLSSAYGSANATTTVPLPAYVDITFSGATTPASLTHANTSGVWTGTNPSSVGATNAGHGYNKGIAEQKLPAGVAGRIFYQFDIAFPYTRFGLATVNDYIDGGLNDSTHAWFEITELGTVITNNPSANNTTYAPTNGEYLGMYRQSDGIIKYQRSADTITWVDLTNGVSDLVSTADLYIVDDISTNIGKLSHPKGEGIVAR